jgi:hypothetical protein
MKLSDPENTCVSILLDNDVITNDANANRIIITHWEGGYNSAFEPKEGEESYFIEEILNTVISQDFALLGVNANLNIKVGYGIRRDDIISAYQNKMVYEVHYEVELIAAEEKIHGIAYYYQDYYWNGNKTTTVLSLTSPNQLDLMDYQINDLDYILSNLKIK